MHQPHAACLQYMPAHQGGRRRWPPGCCCCCRPQMWGNTCQQSKGPIISAASVARQLSLHQCPSHVLQKGPSTVQCRFRPAAGIQPVQVEAQRQQPGAQLRHTHLVTVGGAHPTQLPPQLLRLSPRLALLLPYAAAGDAADPAVAALTAAVSAAAPAAAVAAAVERPLLQSPQPNGAAAAARLPLNADV